MMIKMKKETISIGSIIIIIRIVALMIRSIQLKIKLTKMISINKKTLLQIRKIQKLYRPGS